MTVKEAILEVLEGKVTLTYLKVHERIIEQNLNNANRYTISAQLGNFIRNKDTRVKRIKG